MRLALQLLLFVLGLGVIAVVVTRIAPLAPAAGGLLRMVLNPLLLVGVVGGVLWWRVARRRGQKPENPT